MLICTVVLERKVCLSRKLSKQDVDLLLKLSAITLPLLSYNLYSQWGRAKVLATTKSGFSIMLPVSKEEQQVLNLLSAKFNYDVSPLWITCVQKSKYAQLHVVQKK